jgi:glutathione peroxidase
MRKVFTIVLSGAIFLAIKACVFGHTKTTDMAHFVPPAETIYSISLKTLDGKGQLDFTSFKGKKILIVNTASECGYTYQYEGLEKLYGKYKEKLVIIGCPCNQFGGQEPGDSTEISGFCKKNYGVTFPLSEKLDVKGNNQHPLYKWLTNKSSNGALDATVTWNFNKFLLDENGNLIAYFPSKVKPEDPELISAIEK